MGHHFVPQKHLRRFEIPERPGFVWMYDKMDRTWRHVSIKKAAQAPDFYDPHIESALAEGPANSLIDKLAKCEDVNNEDRTQLSLYFMTMATRGPKRRRISMDLIPKALDEVYAELKQEIEELRSEGLVELAESRTKELEAVRKKFAKQSPQNIIDQIRVPFWSEKTLLCVHNMVWRLVPARAPVFYITSDTPVHLFDWFGVGTPNSEMTIPISKDLALIGAHDWPRPAATLYMEAAANTAHEVNRRIASYAERFIFSPAREDWIAEISDNPPQLNKIHWISIPA